MKIKNCIIIQILTVVLAAVPSFAAGKLPSLAVSSEFSTGKLPNGMKYYFVNNNAIAGYADILLVQKTVVEDTDIRPLLTRLPHFGSSRPYRFFAANGTGYIRDGLVSVRGDASVLSLRNVPVSNRDICDSTLLAVFDYASFSREDQALIVCGDIKPDELRDRVKMLSFCIPTLKPATSEVPYEWKSKDSLIVTKIDACPAGLAPIEVRYRMRRIPVEMMNTPQSVVTYIFAKRLGMVFERKLKSAFQAASLPLGPVSVNYRSSAYGPGDETISFRVAASASKVRESVSLVSSVLSSLDSAGVSVSEYESVKQFSVTEFLNYSVAPELSNVIYTERCLANYLYGSNLASRTFFNDFVSSGRLTTEQERILFNGFVSSLLSSSGNATVVAGGDVPAEELASVFSKAWTGGVSCDFSGDYADTLKLYKPVSKTRLVRDVAEPVSGGRLWTFANGISVIFKKTSSPSYFNYSLMVRGGYTLVPGLKSGEAAYVSGMLTNSTIAGMSGSAFHNMLNANGITMKEDVSISDMRISGTAPSSKLPLLLRALLSVSKSEGDAADAFEYCKSCSDLSFRAHPFSADRINDRLDSLVCPGFAYSVYGPASAMGRDFPKRAGAYFKSQFSRMNDGAIVIIGNLDEEVLKKTLCMHLGDFVTSKTKATRPKVSFPMTSGKSLYTVHSSPLTVADDAPDVNVILSAQYPYSLDRYLGLKLARKALQARLASAFADSGYEARVVEKIEFFPVERISLFVNCWKCRKGGLPYGVSVADPVETSYKIRKVVSELAAKPVSDSELKRWKNAVVSETAVKYSDSRELMDAVLKRFADGKDICYGYRDKAAVVTPQSLQAVFQSLQGGCRVEYVIL